MKVSLEQMLAKGIKAGREYRIEHELIDNIELGRFEDRTGFEESLPIVEIFNKLDYYFGYSEIKTILEEAEFIERKVD